MSESDRSLMQSLIGTIWHQLKVQEPAFYQTSDSRSTIHYLCLLTNLTYTDLGRLCSVSPNYFRMIEERNGHIPGPLCHILRNIATDHYLDNLAGWFDQMEHIQNSRKRASKRWGQ
jgi:hypothetical protein